MFEALLNAFLAPAQVHLSLLSLLSPELLGEVEEPVGGIGAPVQDHVLDALQEIPGNLVVDLEHPGIDDPHVHSGAGGVIEEGGVHGLPHHVVAPEGKGNVGNSSGDLGVGQVLLDPPGSLDEVDGIVVVLLDPGGHGQNIGIEDDVFGREVYRIDEDAVCAFADADLVLIGCGLSLFVESHHDPRGPIAADDPGLLLEAALALLERDRVYDSLALETLQSGLKNLPFGRVDHERDPRYVRFALQQLQEPGHHGHSVDQSLVEADVDNVGAIGDLLTGDLDRLLQSILLDQFAETGRTSYVGAFPDHEEIGVRVVDIGISATEAERSGFQGHYHRCFGGSGGVGTGFAGGVLFHGIGDGGKVVGSVAAAATCDIDQSCLCKFAHEGGHVVRSEVETGGSEGIG